MISQYTIFGELSPLTDTGVKREHHCLLFAHRGVGVDSFGDLKIDKNITDSNITSQSQAARWTNNRFQTYHMWDFYIIILKRTVMLPNMFDSHETTFLMRKFWAIKF